MTQSISPLDDTLIRFDAAAALLANREPNATPDAMLEMLVQAAWRGDYNPPCQYEENDDDHSQRDDPDNWLRIPIEAPSASLTQGQLSLKPRPFKYYEGGCETLLSVMYCMRLLPGDQSAWDDLLNNGNGRMYLHGAQDALTALVGLPLNTYSEAGRAYFAGLYIPRRMLQAWLDQRSSRFLRLFNHDQASDHHPITEPANDRHSHATQTRRGRPTLGAWPSIAAWALELNESDPDMPRKELAGRLYERALQEFEAADVPNETTILRRLAGMLDNREPPMRGDA
ncbi:MAG: hypothetical protein V7651_04815 [Hyphomonas oceanitis]|uniref:hypothetical protein n=1 Tax=Hyphomonas oceanitis TaxID=81033 RepID=UPI0030024C27